MTQATKGIWPSHITPELLPKPIHAAFQKRYSIRTRFSPSSRVVPSQDRNNSVGKPPQRPSGFAAPPDSGGEFAAHFPTFCAKRGAGGQQPGFSRWHRPFDPRRGSLCAHRSPRVGGGGKRSSACLIISVFTLVTNILIAGSPGRFGALFRGCSLAASLGR
jgi:hypothetical protein